MTNPKQNKEALGKGIRSLLQSIDSDLKTQSGGLKTSVVESVMTIQRLPVTDIEANPMQPRRDFDEASLQELAASIKMHDLVQPVTVTQLPNGKFRLISGERRWRAAKIAGLTDIPAYIRQANDHQLLELALLENLQREDLNPMEIALSYKRMMDELHYTQEQVAERMGKERSTIANYVRLLKLPPDIQVAVRKGEFSMGHARALINVETIEKQLFIFHEVLDRKLSVRQTEELVRKINHPEKRGTASPATPLPPAFKKIQDQLSSHFGTKVRIDHRIHKGQGSITIEYYSLEQFNQFLEKVGVSAD